MVILCDWTFLGCGEVAGSLAEADEEPISDPDANWRGPGKTSRGSTCPLLHSRKFLQRKGLCQHWSDI